MLGRAYIPPAQIVDKLPVHKRAAQGMARRIVVIHIPDGAERGMAITDIEYSRIAAEALGYSVRGGNNKIVPSKIKPLH